MFQSKTRLRIITQSEHERLAGTFANLWGNQEFERPALDFDAFVQGVALHDWHYGVIDTLPIGGSNEDEWLTMVQKGVTIRFDNPVTDIVAKLHIRRLLSGGSSPQALAMIERIDQRIAERLPETGFTRQQFERADRITRFCDHLAFDFCFEEPAEGTLGVYASSSASEETPITYTILPGGRISISPWPFSASTVTGIVMSYRADDYPETLTPEIIRFCAER